VEEKLPEIYSKKAILGFSIFLSTLFGGVLLFQNLMSVNRKKEAYTTLGISVVITILTAIVINIPEKPISAIAYVCGFAGGALLSDYFVPKYFPDEWQYPKKPIWKPLIIGLILVAILVTLAICSASAETV